MKKRKNEAQLLQGNEAIVEAAIAAGVRFFAGYPITPATEILERFAWRMQEVGGAFIQMEDEISALSAVIGAAVGGAKAMTATSGPGMSLMSENIGLAIVEEIPCVIVDVQRVGPGSGMIMASQGDVMYAKWGTPGGNEIIALAPWSVKECFDLTIKCVNLAERFRVPVFLLSDAHLGHMREIVDFKHNRIDKIERKQPTCPPKTYLTYGASEDGVPEMADVGTPYRSKYTPYLHDQRGVYGPSPQERRFLIHRLHNKILAHMEEIAMVDQALIEDAKVAVFAYGTCARVARAAIELARKDGIRAGLLRPITLWPFPARSVIELSRRVERIVVAEMNCGQLLLEVERVSAGRAKVSFVGEDDGILMKPEKILAAIEEN
jgi:2-oxoglutarate ferredoxin oxidoreductase subunit alpha